MQIYSSSITDISKIANINIDLKLNHEFQSLNYRKNLIMTRKLLLIA